MIYLKMLFILLIFHCGTSASESNEIIYKQYYILFPTDIDQFGIAMRDKIWSIIDNKFKEQNILIGDKNADLVNALVVEIIKDFKPKLEIIKGNGYSSMSIVIGSLASNVTYNIGWNSSAGQDAPDKVLELRSLLSTIVKSAQQGNSPRPTKNADPALQTPLAPSP